MQHHARQFEAAEHMDADAADPAALERALSFIRRVNRLLGYNAATLRALGELMGENAEGGMLNAEWGGENAECGMLNAEWPKSAASSASRKSGIPHSSFIIPHSPPLIPHSPLSVLDIATGSADLPQEIIAWGRRRGMKIECVGLDRHPVTLAVARKWAPEVPLVRGDALRLPFADGSFDFATCCMFLHHLETGAAVGVIREMERVTRRGWIVADLLRRRRALAWISLFTLFAGPMERHDARVSVKQAWSPEEARELASRAGVEARYREVFGHRFLLVREQKPEQKP